MSTSAEIRRSEILNALAHARYLNVADLSDLFGVSQMSIRRDLCGLEEMGLLRRMHHRLVATPLLRLGLEVSPQVAAQFQGGWQEKEAIAQAAATLVLPGDHLIFDSGILSYLTACALSGELLTEGELTVITNSLLVAMQLAPWPGVEMILLGGEYQANGMMNLTGSETLRELQGLHADKMFMTVEAIDIQGGLTTSSRDTELLQRMTTACAALILLAEGTRLGQVEQHLVVPISSVRALVTDQNAPANFISSLRSQGVDIILAQPGWVARPFAAESE